MGFMEKLASAKNAEWITEGLSKSEVKTVVDLAKISAKIERCRIEMNMTQKEFADFMGVSQGMVSKWESREYNFTIRSLNEICEKLNLQFDVELVKSSSRTEYGVIRWDEERIKAKRKRNEWKKRLNLEEGIA